MNGCNNLIDCKEMKGWYIMQNRMKTHALSEDKINSLLHRAKTCNLATLNSDGTPYCTPIHFIYWNDAIYFHGLPKGQKLDNISHDSRVGISVYEMEGLLLDSDGKPCDTNTKYESIIISGIAKEVLDINDKEDILKRIIKKYTPNLAEIKIPDNMVEGTAVMRIDIIGLSGKYYE